MQRKKSLIAGIICGIACVAAILLYAGELNAAVEAERAEVLSRFGGEQVEAYVALEDIAAGESIDRTNTEKRLWVGELLPADAVFDLSDVEGKALSSAVYKGEVVTLKRFAEEGTASLQVPEGMCAVSVPAKSVSAVGGSVKAGSYVDVYATAGNSTERLASSVLVLSTSATSAQKEGDEADVSWVTLAVRPDLVEEVIAAAQKTELYFSLPSEVKTASDGRDSIEDEDSRATSSVSEWSPEVRKGAESISGDGHSAGRDAADADEEGADASDSGETTREGSAS